MSISKKTKQQHGLTLVETIVALSIIMTGVMACLTLMLYIFNYTQKNEKELLVVNLAKEGTQIVRTIRNDASIDLFDGTYDDKNFIVDVQNNFNLNTEVSGEIEDCSECQLYILNNQYLHDTNGEIASYKRMIKIISISSYEKKIISEISWNFKSNTYNFKLESNLTDWPDAIKLFN